MDRWRDRIAVVTGASSGIGEAIAKDLVRAGLQVIAVARREPKLQQIHEDLSTENSQFSTRFHSYKADVTDEAAVNDLFKWIDEKFGRVDILVNNAGVLKETTLLDPENGNDIRDTVATNILGVVYSTREAFNLMRKHEIDDGHIVVVSSYSGHITPIMGEDFPSLNIYPATKHAIRSMIETYRQDFLRQKTKMKITGISPGIVATELFPSNMNDIVKNNVPILACEDVSNAVLYALGTPPHVQIHDIIIKPIGESI